MPPSLARKNAPPLDHALPSRRSAMKRVNLLIVLALLGLSVVLVWSVTAAVPHTINWSAYGYSEWLLNYNAGFVRRGFAGWLLNLARLDTDWISAINHLVLGIYALLCALLFALWWRSRWHSTVALVLVLLMPGGIVHMGFADEYFFRKEMLFHIALALDCLVYVALIQTATDTRRVLLGALFFALFIAQSLALPLVHEEYLFISYPAAFVLARGVAQTLGAQRIFTRLVWLTVAIQLTMLAVCFAFRGNVHMADALWMTLDPALRAQLSPATPDSPYGAIMIIGWSTLANIALSWHILVSGQFWEWGIGAVGIGAVLMFVTSRRDALDSTRAVAALRQRLAILAFLALCSIPIYILAMDWGRWMSAVALSYVMLLLVDRHAALTAPDLLSRVPRALYQRIAPAVQFLSHDLMRAVVQQSGRHPRACFALSLFFCLTYRLPECCMLMGFSPFFRLRPVIDHLLR